jgi:hypothetical protein
VPLRRVSRADLDPIPLDVIFDDREETDHLGRLGDRHVLLAVEVLDRDIACSDRERGRARSD